MPAVRALIVALLSAGCSWQQPSPNLLHLTVLGPTRVDTGDRLEIIGDGFPEGKAATLTFRGSVHRPGQPVDERAEVVLRAEGSSTHRLTAVLSDGAQARFCGSGDEATSATFRGSVVAAFSPRAAGAPPITGVLDGVVMEVIAPPNSVQEHRRRHVAARAALTSSGITLSDEQPGHLVVGAVHGLAAEAGLLPGDELVELDGMRLTAPVDYIPPGDASAIDLVVRRPNVDVPFELRLESDEFRHFSTADTALALLLVVLAGALAFIFAGPLPIVSAWFARSLRLRLGADGSTGQPSPSWLRAVLGALSTPFVAMPPLLRLGPHLSFAALVGLWACLAFGGEVLAAGLDSLAILAVANTAALLAAMLSGGRAPGEHWSMARGLGAALRTLVHQVPQLLGLLTVLTLVGSLRLADLIADQNTMPSDWLAFRSPGTWLGLGVLIIGLIPKAVHGGEYSPVALPRERELSARRLPALEALATLLECVHLWLMAGLIAAAFLGGWALPDAAVGAGLPGSLLGAVVFQLKAWGIVFVVVALRWTLQEVHQRDTLCLIATVLTPVAIVALLSSVAWAQVSGLELLRASRGGLSTALLVLSALTGAGMVRKLTRLRRPDLLQGQINPWL